MPVDLSEDDFLRLNELVVKARAAKRGTIEPTWCSCQQCSSVPATIMDPLRPTASVTCLSDVGSETGAALEAACAGTVGALVNSPAEAIAQLAVMPNGRRVSRHH